MSKRPPEHIIDRRPPNIKRCKGIVKTEVVNTWVDDDRRTSDGGVLVFQRRIFPDDIGARYLEALRKLDWQTHEITIKSQKHPRKMFWVNNNNIPYNYNGISLSAQPWTPELLEIKQKVEGVLEKKQMPESFDCAMLNLYEDASHFLGIHADDEPLWGANPTVASVSLGDERDFDLISNPSPTAYQTKLRYLLRHSSLLVMRGAIQSNWKHTLPKRAKAAIRINITFRTIVHPPAPPLPAPDGVSSAGPVSHAQPDANSQAVVAVSGSAMPSSPALNGTALAPDSATSNSVLAPSASHAHVPSHTPSHNTQSHNESPSHHESSQSDIGASSVPPAPAAVAEASPGSLAHTATAAMRPVSTTQAAALHSSSTSSKLPEQTGSNTLDASAAAGDLSTAGAADGTDADAEVSKPMADRGESASIAEKLQGSPDDHKVDVDLEAQP